MKNWLSWFEVPDKLPERADVVYCPSYCLTRDFTRLTEMSAVTAAKAIELVKRGAAEHLVFTAAYCHVWRREADLKLEFALRAGIKAENIFIVPEITSTFDAVQKARKVLKNLEVSSLIMVAEQYHMRRSLDIMNLFLPEIRVYPVSVRCPRYEFSAEPSFVKSVRTGFKSSWILWNIAAYLRYGSFRNKA